MKFHFEKLLTKEKVPRGLSHNFSISSIFVLLDELSTTVVVVDEVVSFEVLSFFSDDFTTVVVVVVDDDPDDKSDTVEAISDAEDWTVFVITDCCWNVFSKSKSASSKYFVYVFVCVSVMPVSGLDVYSTNVRVTVDVMGIGTDLAFSDVIVVTVVVVVSGRVP